jgi:heptosyltransferase-2
MGDILLTTPLIRSIKKQNPDVKIDFVLKDEFLDLLKNNPHLSSIYRYSKKYSKKQEMITSLNTNNYDLVIDLQNNHRSNELTKKMNCQTFRFKKNNFNKFLLVHFKINRLKEERQIPVRYADVAGIELDNEGLELITDKNPDSILTLNEKYIGLCPGAKHFTKRWPKENFIALGKKLESEGYKVILFGGLSELEITNEIANQLNSPINFCAESILQSAANMKVCKVIYTNDSGTMHIACAMNIPVIAFFGSTVREFGFYPYKAKSMELEIQNLSCRPCTHIGRKSCPKIHFKCMKEINPELAVNSLNMLQLS